MYDYIYVLDLEEKYDLLNKVNKGVINEKEAISLRAKHIQIMDYDHCIEITELKIEDIEHYYCYDKEEKVVDHIMLGDIRNLEIIEQL